MDNIKVYWIFTKQFFDVVYKVHKPLNIIYWVNKKDMDIFIVYE